MSDQLLKTPLFEVGSIWVKSAQDLGNRIRTAILLLSDFRDPATYVTIAVALASIVALYYLYELLFVPLNRVRLLGDLGYVPEGKLTQKDMVNVVRKRRMVGDLPPVYPNGWFAVFESHELKSGQVHNVSFLGKNLAVFRSEKGTAHVLDAYCPHLGANLAIGGQVKGDCLECPFHGWQFRGDDGKCVKVPYIEDKNIPAIANIHSYQVLEQNGFVQIWYHAEGVEPHWTPPVIDEIANGDWTYRGRTEHVINCHIEEVPENGSDVAHLGHLHGPIMFAGIDLRYTYDKIWSFGKHMWAGEWSQCPDEKHVGILRLKHSMKLFGIHIPLLDMDVEARQTGPGIVYLLLKNKFWGRGALMHCVTPMEPMQQKMVHQIYVNRYLPTVFAKFIMLGEALMVERDIMIWNNKKYEGKPVYVKSKEDGLIAKHRRWYSQFYSENSPRLSFKQDNMEW
ncbi:hypothetical protein CAPTEDRAFT_130540 [Capitella teleta]|uniref:cholesterol 7-desaturase n=1 Tax=Capitella teleta TaxID=283909 RepID=R7UPX0_CAPTE|nr:hypothetical protein CAPTEDRAFT_130540 [Capitella teleta]|eukprot:ELU08143.1 hypothetical protein CAPTEDRAFT_130540 [Capitella teleta]